MTRRAGARIARAMIAGTAGGAGALFAAGLLAAAPLVAPQLVAPPAAADEYGYRLRDGNRRLFGGPSGVQIYRPQPYRSPLYQPRRQNYDPGWRAARPRSVAEAPPRFAPLAALLTGRESEHAVRARLSRIFPVPSIEGGLVA